MKREPVGIPSVHGGEDVKDVKVLDLDVLRTELRKVRQQYRRPQAG